MHPRACGTPTSQRRTNNEAGHGVRETDALNMNLWMVDFHANPVVGTVVCEGGDDRFQQHEHYGCETIIFHHCFPLCCAQLYLMESSPIYLMGILRLRSQTSFNAAMFGGFI
jgi:hypothetical protein